MSLLDVLSPALVGYGWVYSVGAIVAGSSLLAVALGKGVRTADERTPAPQPPDGEDYATQEFPPFEDDGDEVPEPRTMLGRDALLWGLTTSDEQGEVTLALYPTPDGRLAVLVDVDGAATGVWMGRAEVQDFRVAVTGWLCDTARTVA